MSKTKSVTLADLTPEEKLQLLNELQQQEKDKSETQRIERQKYKELVDKEITICFPVLQEVSKAISAAKKYVYDNLSTLISIKSEIYEREADQNSHSFTNQNGTITIILGYNMLDSYDDTVDVGVSKVQDFLKTLGKDKESSDMVDTISKLLSRDTKGNLKPSRVIQLQQWAEKTGNKGFIDAIKIIQDAYKPVRSKEFIRCIFKNEKGENITVPLSITDAPFPVEEPEPTK